MILTPVAPDGHPCAGGPGSFVVLTGVIGVEDSHSLVARIRIFTPPSFFSKNDDDACVFALLTHPYMLHPLTIFGNSHQGDTRYRRERSHFTLSRDKKTRS